jgi:pyruvate dehydrogenase E1 component
MVMLGNGVATTDTGPVETHEWRDALDGVLDVEGPERAQFLLNEVFSQARRKYSA